MSIIGLVSLICALASGVFAVDSTSAWTWWKGSFVMFLTLAVAAFVASTLRRPSLLWEVVDDIQRKRFQHAHQSHVYRMTDDQPDEGHHLHNI